MNRVMTVLAVTALLLAAVVAVMVGSPGSAPEGRVLLPASAAQVLTAVREPGASVVVVNVWATWCIPCREEFPDLLRLRRSYRDRGLRLVLVSGDFSSERDAALGFLAEQGVDFPTYLKEGDDMEFINALDRRWSGALPATFVYDSSGMLQHFREGKTSYADFETMVQGVLAQGSRPTRKEPS
jgi:thiol-disulfide isomerase/thioredoxin